MRTLSTTRPSDGGMPRDRCWLPPQTPARELAVAAAHNGAGATTLARLLPPARDISTVHPDTGTTTGLWANVPLLLACRPVTSSAIAATETVCTLAQTGVRVAVLISGDGWPEDPAATACYWRLAPHVGAVARMPFIVGIRGFSHPENVRLPQDAHHVLTGIRVLATCTGATTARAVHRVRCAA